MGTILDLTSGATSLFRKNARAGEASETRPSQQPPELPRPSRDTLARELGTLRARELAILRQLASHDHPELAGDLDQLRVLLEAASQARAQMARGPSEEDLQKREALERKLDVLREHRAEIDGKIEGMTMELFELNVAMERARGTGYAQALRQLREAVARTQPKAASLNVGLPALFPELPSLLAERADEEVAEMTLPLELVSDEDTDDTLARAFRSAVSAAPA